MKVISTLSDLFDWKLHIFLLNILCSFVQDNNSELAPADSPVSLKHPQILRNSIFPDFWLSKNLSWLQNASVSVYD